MRSLWQRVLPQGSLVDTHEDVQAPVQPLRPTVPTEETLKRTCQRETRTNADDDVPMLALRVQEHQPGHAERPHHSQTHEQLPLRLCGLPKEVQTEERPEAAHEPDAQQCPSRDMFRLRSSVQEYPSPEASYQVQPQQASLRVQHMQALLVHRGEFESTHTSPQTEGEGGVSDVWEDT